MTQFATPSKAYLVCATPRSGSTLLCEMLRETGGAGEPLEHFEILRQPACHASRASTSRDLDAPTCSSCWRRWRPGRPSDETARGLVGAHPGAREARRNGVWGGKIMWGQSRTRRARTRAGRAAPTPTWTRCCVSCSTIPSSSSSPAATRRHRRCRCGARCRPRAGAPARRRAPIPWPTSSRRSTISSLSSRPTSGLERVVRRARARKPIHVTYDRLDAAPGHAVEVVLHALGLPDSAVAVPRLSRQRDDLSAAWIERYRQERGRAA